MLKRTTVAPGQVCPPSSSSNTDGSMFFLSRRCGQHLEKGVRSCPHEQHALKRPAGTRNAACLCLPLLTLDRSIWPPFFCNVVVQGILEHLSDLFHIFVWAIVGRDAPTRDAGCRAMAAVGAERPSRQLCVFDDVASWSKSSGNSCLMITGTLGWKAAAKRERTKAVSRACTLKKCCPSMESTKPPILRDRNRPLTWRCRVVFAKA